jgi:hypothetical protein
MMRFNQRPRVRISWHLQVRSLQLRRIPRVNESSIHMVGPEWELGENAEDAVHQCQSLRIYI